VVAEKEKEYEATVHTLQAKIKKQAKTIQKHEMSAAIQQGAGSPMSRSAVPLSPVGGQTGAWGLGFMSP
jgi:hypothetical protein